MFLVRKSVRSAKTDASQRQMQWEAQIMSVIKNIFLLNAVITP